MVPSHNPWHQFSQRIHYNPLKYHQPPSKPSIFNTTHITPHEIIVNSWEIIPNIQIFPPFVCAAGKFKLPRPAPADQWAFDNGAFCWSRPNGTGEIERERVILNGESDRLLWVDYLPKLLRRSLIVAGPAVVDSAASQSSDLLVDLWQSGERGVSSEFFEGFVKPRSNHEDLFDSSLVGPGGYRLSAEGWRLWRYVGRVLGPIQGLIVGKVETRKRDCATRYWGGLPLRKITVRTTANWFWV